jgi:signal transduction histidine kinase
MTKLPKLLIIDDEEIVIDSCTSILAGGAYEIATARNGDLGLQLLEKFQPDLVFVDLKMPGISGFEVLEKIHSLDPTIVTIVITGFATVSSAVEAMKKGSFDFLPKPFTPDELRLITRRAIEKRRLVLETISLRREKEMLREHFAAIVSHELKSPLSAVQQQLFLLSSELEGLLSKAQQGRMERLQTRIADLMKLIHTWLRVISRDIGEIKDQFEPLEIPRVLAKAIESTATHADRKDIEVKAEIHEPLPSVFGDEGTLVEAVVNLIGNAVKYSRGGSQVRITAAMEHGEICIYVVDTGVGIPEEDLPHIFEDFYAGKHAPGEKTGSGLGLALTRRIVKAHSGVILAESELGKGSTFKIRLPALSNASEKETIGMTKHQGGLDGIPEEVVDY